MLLATRPARSLKIAPSTVLLLCVTAGQMVVLTVLFWGSNFWYDDLLYLEQVKQGTIGLHHLMFPMFGHMAPGHNFVYWALERFAPARFHVALVLEALISGAVTLVLARVLRLLTQRPMLSAVVASLLAVSATQVAAFAWLAAAADCTFSTLFTLLAAERFLVWRLNRRTSVLVSCLVLWAVGLSFYEEPAFLPVYLAALFGFVLPNRWTWAEAKRELVGVWQAWVGFALVGLVWVVLYATGPYGSFLPRPSVDQFVAFEWTAWFRNFWMTAVGAPVSLIGPQGGLLLKLFGQAVFVLLVAVTVARRPAAWRAWVFFVVSFVLHVGVIAYGRAWMGASQGLQSFYVYESGWLLAISFVCAVGPASLARKPVPQREVPRRATRPRSARVVSTGMVAGLLVLASLRGVSAASTTFHNYPGQNINTWTRNVQSSAAAIRRTGHTFSVFDTKVATFFWQFSYPATNRASVVLGIGYADLTYNKLGLPGYVIDPLGRLVPAKLAVHGQWKPKQRKVECWSGQKVLVLSHAVKDDSLFLRLRTDQPVPVRVRIWARPPAGGDAIANDTDGMVDLSAGPSDLLIPMMPTEAKSVVISTDGPQVCVSAVQLGPAKPLSAA